jgi:hypothetical protein
MFAIPLDIIELVKDIGQSVSRKSDGGKKITLAEAEEILTDIKTLAEHLAAAIARQK